MDMESTLISSPSLGARNESHGIIKLKPKIRIIHIFAPEIIKTDAANFRELVQRLTGKPAEKKVRRKNSRRLSRPYEPVLTDSSPETVIDDLPIGDHELSAVGRVKKEEAEMWGCVNWSLIGEFGSEMGDGFSSHDHDHLAECSI